MAAGANPTVSRLRPQQLAQANVIDDVAAVVAMLEQQHAAAVERAGCSRRW